MKAYENLIHITPDMVVLESIGTTISPMTGLSYAVMQDGKHYDPDTETYIGEIDVDEYMGTISNDDEITFMALQDQELNDYKFEKGGMITEESNYDIIANVKKEQGESDFYYALYDKLVAYGERPKIAFSEMKEVFDNYDEDMSDYIDLPFAKGGSLVGTLKERYINFLKENNVDVDRYKFKYIKSGLYGEEEVWTHLIEKTGKNSGFITTTDTFDMLLSGEYGVDDFIYGNGLITRFEKGGVVVSPKNASREDIEELENYLDSNSWKVKKEEDVGSYMDKLIISTKNVSRDEIEELNEYLDNNSWDTWSNHIEEMGQGKYERYMQMEKGGSVDKDLPYLIYVSNTNNPNPNKQLVAKVRSKGDAILIQSELSKNVAEAPLEYFLQDK